MAITFRVPETTRIAPTVVPRNMKVGNRYVWAAGSATTLIIPKTWPDMPMGAPVWRIRSMIRIALTRAGLQDETLGNDLMYRIGWSADGVHWVLFGLDDNKPSDVAVMVEFPQVLRVAIKSSSLNLHGEGTGSVYENMKAAFMKREP